LYGSVTGSNDYPYNTQATLTSTQNYNYIFTQLTSNGTIISTNNPFTFTVTRDTSIVAHFVPDTFTVSASANNPLYGSINGSGDYPYNGQATIIATANHGYIFKHWTSNGIIISNANPFTFTVTMDTTIVANFVIDTFTISASANNPLYGSVTRNNDYPYNTQAILMAIANQGYVFKHWTNDGIIISTSNPFIFIVTKDTSIVAHFVPDTFTVSTSANNPLYGSINGSGDYPYNGQATITAISNHGYIFKHWTSNGIIISNTNPFTFTVTMDTTMVANFVPDTFTVFISANNPLYGSVTGSNDYPYNTQATITATANTGYSFLKWNDDSTQNPRTITVTQDTTFIATFAVTSQKTCHVTLSSNNPIMGSVTGEGNYAENTAATIEAIPNTGYRFIQWNDGNKENPRTITLTQDTSFIATFAVSSQNTYHVSVSSNDQTKGTVLGGGDYAKNSTVSIGAMANQGYRFAQWDDGNTDNPRSITVTQDTAFVATFESEIGIVDIKISSVSIFPNPATDNITVTLPENVHQATFTVYDMQGKMLLQQNIGNQETVSVSNLSAGVYIYHVRTEKESYTGKIVLR
jgi:hypothetical protein